MMITCEDDDINDYVVEETMTMNKMIMKIEKKNKRKKKSFQNDDCDQLDNTA